MHGDPDRDPYRFAAPIYDLATAAWTGGAIWRSRVRCLDGLRSGETVLIPGAGTGRLVARAAALGAQVTALEPSPGMRKRLLRRLKRAGASAEVQAEVIDCQLAELDPALSFERVVAEHFLNVFPPEPMVEIRRQLVDRIRPGGRFAVADFTPPEEGEGMLSRKLKGLYHVLPLGGCALLTGNAMHPIYDHGRDLSLDPRMTLRSVSDARIYGIGPGYFRTWIWSVEESQRRAP